MSWAVWITGLPGSGKSAIARAAAAELAATGDAVQVLELDVLRRTLTPSPTYDATEREAVHRALVVIARVLARAGRPVIIDATAHRRAWRDLARACIDNFAEVQLVCPLEVAGEPGVDVAYEEAADPELAIDTTQEVVRSAAARVAALARSFPRALAPATLSGGWAIWISGPPGSGKTTVVSTVCERLAARGATLAVLEVQEFTALIAACALPSREQREIVARAIVLAAALLRDAGHHVIIDGAAPVPEGERWARETIEAFGQVELVCPVEVCRTRERAVRWRLVPCPGGTQPMTAPDLGLDYQAPSRPDLVLYTDVVDHRSTADEIVRFAERLDRAATTRSQPCA